MIELNLLEKKEPFKLPSVMGVDLNQINLVMMVIAILFYYIPPYIFVTFLESQHSSADEQIKELKEQGLKIQKQLEKNKEVKLELKAYQDQAEKLNARSKQVDEILKIRTNPRKVLEKIARSIPEELWFDQLMINNLNEIEIKGGTFSSRSLGEFITSLNDSPFFNGSVTPTRQENKQEQLDGSMTNYDAFELKGKIKNYDMRSN
jgi:hypothetical protein